MPSYIKKRDGKVVEFQEGLLRRSLARAGASKDTIEKVLEDIVPAIKENDTTDHVYRRAFTLLGQLEKAAAMRYSLRTSIFSYGPTGFPFEKFVGRLFEKSGYTVEYNKEVLGKCTHHEVDVLASGKKNIAMEVKFHSRVGLRIDLRTVLYVHARFQDLTARQHVLFPIRSFYKGKILHRDDIAENFVADQGLLVTNSKFTSRAIQYAECAGVDLLGWGYPKGAGLERLIEATNTHPVTCLPSLRSRMVQQLFDNDIIICSDLINCPRGKLVRIIGDGDIADSLYEEARLICRT